MIRYNELSGYNNENYNTLTSNATFFGGGGSGVFPTSNAAAAAMSTQRMPLSNIAPESSVVSNSTGLSFVWGGDNSNSASMVTGNPMHQRPAAPNSMRTNNWHQQQPRPYSSKNSEKMNFVQEDQSMFWTNPYTKKKADPDKGTSIWGDPNKQGPIRRWKNCSDEPVILPPEKPLEKDKSKQAGNSQSSAFANCPGNFGAEGENHATASAQQENGTKTGSSSAWDTNRSNTPTAANQSAALTSSSWPSLGNNEQPCAAETKALGWDLGPNESKRGETVFHGAEQSQPFMPARPRSVIGAERQSAFGSDTSNRNEYGPPGTYGNHQGVSKGDLFTSTPFSNDPSTQAFAADLSNRLAAVLRAPPGMTSRPSREGVRHAIVEQLKRAVRAGFMHHSLLGAEFLPEQLELLNSCLHAMTRLEHDQRDFNQMVFTSQEHKEKAEYHIQQMTKQLQFHFNELKQNVDHQLTNGGGCGASRSEPFPTLGNMTRSKLEQWKRGATNSNVEKDSDAGFSEPAGSSFSMTRKNLWSNTNVSDVVAGWPTQITGTSKKSGQVVTSEGYTEEDDAAINAVVDDITNDPNEQTPVPLGRTSTPFDDASNSKKSADTNSATASSSPSTVTGAISKESPNRSKMVTPTLINAFDADVPEFKPGQLWLWRDPKELAQDPDATPASVIEKKAALFQSAGSGIGNDTIPRNGNGFTSDYNTLNGGEAFPRIGPNGYLPSTTRASAWIRQQPPHDTWAPMMSNMNGPPHHSGIRGGPPLQLVNPIAGIPPSNGPRAMPYAAIKPGAPASIPAYYAPSPYSALVYSMQWLVLTNLNMMDEQQLQLMMSRFGTLSAFFCPPGAGYAVIRFKEPLEKMLPRINQECTAVGIMVQVAKDDEITSLLQTSNGFQTSYDALNSFPVPLVPAMAASAAYHESAMSTAATMSQSRRQFPFGAPHPSAHSFGMLPPAAANYHAPSVRH